MKRIVIVFLLIVVAQFTRAGEGMWLPQLLGALNEEDMQSMGMKLSAEDIYSVNQGSLKDAIAHFGGFCTSEVISDQGLLLTNHHCGYGQIQSHSSIDDNILKNGFWAPTLADEKPNPGLFARFIVRIDDVTDAALQGVTDGMEESARQSQIDKNLEKVRATYTLGAFEDLIIRPFYHGNQYFAFQTVTYNDVRLVGTPPESIGKFGADTDNWVFPRHTGDFSLFRIYAGPNNEPADYSPNNKPFTPKHSLPISLDGVEEGDFTMVFGFPGRTNQYLPSPAIEMTLNTLNPAKIEIRDKALKVLDKYMRKDEATKIKYASKFASVANYWKKWIGESQGLESTGALAKKHAYEKAFQENADAKYKGLLNEFDGYYKAMEPYAKARDYYNETALRNTELLGMMRLMRTLVSRYEKNGDEGYNSYKNRVQSYLDGFYKNIDVNIDEEVFAVLLDNYAESLDGEYMPKSLKKALKKSDAKAVAKMYYGSTMFNSKDAVFALLNESPKDAVKKIKADKLYKLGADWHNLYINEVSEPYGKEKAKIDSLQRIYMKAQMETFKDKTFWPDANSTLRVTYGQVNGYEPRDAVRYMSKSYTKGIKQKYKPGDYEFDVPEKLLQLIDEKDYGQYVDETGEVPVCFIGTNHTTGGNSGSPAIDAYGNLVGLNFDRVWEGTMSDLNYDPSICRNIMVDARYVLFIIDKYAGAQRLIDEMDLVRPKSEEVVDSSAPEFD